MNLKVLCQGFIKSHSNQNYKIADSVCEKIAKVSPSKNGTVFDIQDV